MEHHHGQAIAAWTSPACRHGTSPVMTISRRITPPSNHHCSANPTILCSLTSHSFATTVPLVDVSPPPGTQPHTGPDPSAGQVTHQIPDGSTLRRCLWTMNLKSLRRGPRLLTLLWTSPAMGSHVSAIDDDATIALPPAQRHLNILCRSPLDRRAAAKQGRTMASCSDGNSHMSRRCQSASQHMPPLQIPLPPCSCKFTNLVDASIHLRPTSTFFTMIIRPGSARWKATRQCGTHQIRLRRAIRLAGPWRCFCLRLADLGNIIIRISPIHHRHSTAPAIA